MADRPDKTHTQQKIENMAHETIEDPLLGDELNRLYNDFEDIMMNFIVPPYEYEQCIVDEALNILDRLGVLAAKLNNEEYRGSFTYG